MEDISKIGRQPIEIRGMIRMRLKLLVLHIIINMAFFATMIVYSYNFGTPRVYTDIYPIWLASTASACLLLVHSVSFALYMYNKGIYAIRGEIPKLGERLNSEPSQGSEDE
jgi:hypothetical protein